MKRISYILIAVMLLSLVCPTTSYAQQEGDTVTTSLSTSKDASGEASFDASKDASGDVSRDASKDASKDADKKKPYEGKTAPAPVLLFKGATSLWVNKEAGDLEYGIRKAKEEKEFSWQDNNLFFGLEVHTAYEIAIRYKEKEQMQAGGIRKILTVTTDDWNYSLRYHLKEGKNVASNPISYQAGAGEVLLVKPKRSGYRFDGWYLDAGLTRRVNSWSASLSTNQHLYAKWTKISQAAVRGVKVRVKSGKKLAISFAKKATAEWYEVQYSKRAAFKKADTVTQLTKGNYTTPALIKGTTYYVRVRSMAYDSCGVLCTGSYSSVVKKQTTMYKNGASAVETGAKKKKKAKKIKKKVVKGKSIYLTLQEKKQLEVPAQLKKEAKKGFLSLSIKSLKPGKAGVTKKGVVTGKKTGKTTIKITGKTKIVKCPVVIEKLSSKISKKLYVVGEHGTISLTGATSKVMFHSSNPSVMTVDQNGTLYAVGKGEAAITMKYHGHTYQETVTVITVEQSYINATKDFYFHCIYKKLACGDSYTIPYSVTPSTIPPEHIVFRSSNPSVATVSNGIVTAKGVGETVISVVYQDMETKMTVQVVNGQQEADAVRLVSHRGSARAPENSMQAFQKAQEEGYEYVETDVRFTKDNVPVLLHDATVYRTSQALENVKLSALTYEQCKNLDFGAYFGKEYKNVKIVRLDEFLSWCRKSGMNCYIELKGDWYYEQCRLIAELVKYYGMGEKTTFISFQQVSLQSVAELLPQARLGVLSNTLDEASVDKVLELKNGTNEVFLDVKFTGSYPLEILQMLGDAQIPLECFTLNTKELVEKARLYGARAVTTDQVTPDIMEKKQ